MGPTRELQRLVVGACALLVMAALLVSTPLPASAAVAAPASLAPNGVSQAGVPALSWSPASEAVRYEVQVSASSTFDNVVRFLSTENTRYVPDIQLPPNTVYWRVRSISSLGTPSSWSSASFARGQSAGPSLQAPVNGDVLPQPTEPPLLSWAPVTGATSYEVSIDNDSDFVDANASSTQTTSHLVTNAEPGTTYWWRVRAVRGNGLNTQWSSEWSYTVGGLPEVQPTLPVEQQKVEDVVFDWPAVPGAKDYELRVGEDRDFNTLVPGTPMVVRGTRYSPPVTYGNDEYYWQVRARDHAGKAIAWTDSRVPVRHFQRHWDGAPVQKFPTDSVSVPVGDPMYFEWTPVDHASRYELQLGSNVNFSPGTYVTCSTRATTYTPGNHGPQKTLDCTPQPGKVYYWRVRGLDEPRNVQGLWSATRAFVYDPGMVTQASPTNGATVDIPTLSWEAARDAERYHVEVRNNSGSVVAATDTYSLSWTPRGKLDPAQGPFRWDVVSIDANGHRSASLMLGDQWTFDLSGDTPAAVEAPLTPVGAETVTARFPELRWEPHPDAAYYRLYIGVADAPMLTAINETYAYPSMTDVSKTYLGTGRYDWIVEAYSSTNTYLGRSPERGTFTIKDLPTVTGQQVALTGTSLADNGCDNALDDTTGPGFCTDLLQTPVLDWDPSPEASHYLVYLARDREMTSPVYNDPFITTQNTRWAPTELLPDSQAGEGYFWYVRPCKAFDVCAPDPTATADSAMHAFDKASLPIELTSPANEATVANEVTLEWKDNLQHLAENPQVLDEGGVSTAATVEAHQYRVQIADNPAFAGPLVDERVDQTTYTPYAGTLPEGPLYWRVQAVDGSNNQLTWSEVRKIDKQSPKVGLRAPADDGVVDGTPYFRWEPQVFAAGYRLEVYKDGDSTLSQANRVISTTTKLAGYTHGQPLPASTKPYLWRVQRLDAQDRPGPWSNVRSFKVTGQAPEQLKPTASEFVDAKQSFFSWGAVAGATTYRFERRLDGSSSMAESVTTHALSWAPTSALADGRWEWRVSSIDAQGAVVATAPWRLFSVDGARPTVTKHTPGRSTTPGADWVVTFSEPVRGVDSTSMRLYREGRADPLAAKITSSNGGRTWTLNPSSSMARRVRYTLKLSSGVTDDAGNKLRGVSFSSTPK